MWNWYVWLGLGLVLFVFATVFTFLWWKVGDQWADAEYKKFGHGGGAGPDLSQATVIRGFDSDDRDDGDGGDGCDGSDPSPQSEQRSA